MSDHAPPSPSDETAILTRLLAEAERLVASPDALMAPQYRHLEARIRALIEVRRGLGVS